MAVDPFLDEDRVLTPEAFEFVLNNELKRAMRSQNYLTLLVIEAKPRNASDDAREVVRELARVVGREVRETDLLSPVEEGRLSLVLLDADLPSSMGVVDRLMSRLEPYQFTTPTTITVGAACCPTHGVDAESLHRAASSQPVHPGRESRGNTSNAQ